MRRSGSGSSLGLTLSASNFGPALPMIQDYSPPGLLGARGMYMIRLHFSTLSIIVIPFLSVLAVFRLPVFLLVFAYRLALFRMLGARRGSGGVVVHKVQVLPCFTRLHQHPSRSE